MSNADASRTRNDIIAAALASGATQREAGQAAQVSERTVRRRMEQPGFAEQVQRERTELVNRVAARLTGLAPKALDTMEALLNEDVAPAVRSRTAAGILTASRVWRDATEMEDRLRLVETVLAAQGQEGEVR